MFQVTTRNGSRGQIITMAKYTGPKDRLSRRDGVDLFGAGGKLTRLNVPPGVHGPKGSRSSSQYSKQLREKQKVKRIYGLMEKQFRRYVDEALKQRGNTGELLLSLLERRLDNTIYRLGFAPSRPAARQFVSHRHVLVDGKRINIPSYRVKVGQTVGLSTEILASQVVKKLLEEEKKLPSWLKRKASVGKVEALPKREDVTEPVSEQDIVEFYSR
jgi:small subunit ribosomal protein S4